MSQRQTLPAAHWSATPFSRLLRPMQEFIQQEQSSGIILLAATLLAIAIANSPLAAGYFALLETKVGFTAGAFELKLSVLHWINDGLMAIFFFLVGLEIKREMLVGELSNPRAAALPLIAATGGALMPAIIFIALNGAGAAARGWGVPMATDIAFALGCLALLGSRVPFPLKIFLTAVAIVDDLIAVLVIAIFYSAGLNLAALAIGLGLIVVLLLANAFGIRSPAVYAGLGAIVWLAFLASGVHATIAGVLVALTIPARMRIDAPTFLEGARDILHQFERGDQEPTRMLTDEIQQSAIVELEDLCEHVQAPLQKIEHALHGPVSLLIMPVFALANAGVALHGGALSGEIPALLGIVLGLVLGKPLGMTGAAWLAVRLGLAELPNGVSWFHMLGAGVLGGIGFTMALFVASLAFAGTPALESAKLAILLASLIAGTAGMILLSRPHRVQ